MSLNKKISPKSSTHCLLSQLCICRIYFNFKILPRRIRIPLTTLILWLYKIRLLCPMKIKETSKMASTYQWVVTLTRCKIPCYRITSKVFLIRLLCLVFKTWYYSNRYRSSSSRTLYSSIKINIQLPKWFKNSFLTSNSNSNSNSSEWTFKSWYSKICKT